VLPQVASLAGVVPFVSASVRGLSHCGAYKDPAASSPRTGLSDGHLSRPSWWRRAWHGRSSLSSADSQGWRLSLLRKADRRATHCNCLWLLILNGALLLKWFGWTHGHP